MGITVPEVGPPTVFPSLLYTIPLPTPILEGVAGGTFSDFGGFVSPIRGCVPGCRSPVELLPVPNVGGGGTEVIGGGAGLGIPTAAPLNVRERLDLVG